MIAEIFPEAYDAGGRKVFRPDFRRRGFHSTAPMRRYVSQPLTVQCTSIAHIREFLASCRYVSDEEQFGKKDYWQPPEEFERTKQGDCDCFALWTWREFLALGYEARFVLGQAGRYRQGHAWVQFWKGGKVFVVEPTAARLGNTIPRLSTLRYRPRFSVAWDGTDLSFYSHQPNGLEPPIRQLIAFVPDWLIFWGWAWTVFLAKSPLRLARGLSRLLRRSRISGSTAGDSQP